MMAYESDPDVGLHDAGTFVDQWMQVKGIKYPNTRRSRTRRSRAFAVTSLSIRESILLPYNSGTRYAVSLDHIVRSTRSKVAGERRTANLAELGAAGGTARAARVFAEALLEVGRTGVAVIAELKKASPSKD